MISAEITTFVQQGLLTAIGGKYLYDRFFKKNSIIDGDTCKKCKQEINRKLESGDNWFKQIARVSRVQALILIKLCEQLPMDINEDECRRLRKQLEEGFEEETKR